jgi:indole-3-glycerol phosphate synthase
MTQVAESDFLAGMAAASQRRSEVARAQLSDAQQRSLLSCLGATTPLMLAPGNFDLIAELKKQSPAEGKLDLGSFDPAYARGGAAALSVLTEPDRFSGSLADLQAIAALNPSVPVMRKDFLVSRFQVREARLAGASGVLLIAAILNAEQLKAMLDAAFELDLFVLLEAFDQSDLEKSVAVDLTGRCRFMLGVNCRDLRTLKVDFRHFERMARLLPAELPCVAESGVATAEQAAEVSGLGYRLALVGTALMRSADPAKAVRELRQAGARQCS